MVLFEVKKSDPNIPKTHQIAPFIKIFSGGGGGGGGAYPREN